MLMMMMTLSSRTRSETGVGDAGWEEGRVSLLGTFAEFVRDQFEVADGLRPPREGEGISSFLSLSLLLRDEEH